MASSSRHTGLTVEDMPDDVLERVFVLAGQRYCPAIVGVSQRWWRVCWGSRQLWRRLDLHGDQPGLPIASHAAAAPAPAAAADQDPQQMQQRRLAGWQAAKRAQLERVGRLAESVTYDDSMAQLAPVSAMLHMLSPEALTDLALYVQTITSEQASLLAGLAGLTKLTLHTPQGGSSAWPVLQQLPRLQHLYLGGYKMGEPLIDTLLPLTGLTRLDLWAAYLPSLLRLTSLRHLRHFSIDVWDREWPSDDAIHWQLPVPASFAALRSYRSSAAFVYGGLQLADFRLQKVVFKPLVTEAGSQPAEHSAQERPVAGQPGSLLIDGLLLAVQQIANAGADEAQEAPAAPEQPPPPLNALLEAAVPPSHTLQQLALSSCCLDTVSLQQLPDLSRLHSLEVRQCWSTGGMDAPLQALVQQAPALASLCFDVQWAEADQCLSAWPAYLLAHPCLRSATLINKGQADWDAGQALLPHTSAAAAEPVLEHLATDGFPAVPRQLAAVTSLRSLAFIHPGFELTASAVGPLLALPHLTSLCLPGQLSDGAQRAVRQLRRARPELTIRVDSP